MTGFQESGVRIQSTDNRSQMTEKMRYKMESAFSILYSDTYSFLTTETFFMNFDF